jgi:hypothetical protein
VLANSSTTAAPSSGPSLVVFVAGGVGGLVALVALGSAAFVRSRQPPPPARQQRAARARDAPEAANPVFAGGAALRDLEAAPYAVPAGGAGSGLAGAARRFSARLGLAKPGQPASSRQQLEERLRRFYVAHDAAKNNARQIERDLNAILSAASSRSTRSSSKSTASRSTRTPRAQA